MDASSTQKAFAGVAALLAAFYAVVGVLVLLGIGNPGEYPRLAWAIVGLAAGAMIVAGLLASRRSPLLGDILVFVGAVPLAVLFFWAIIPIILLVLMVLLRARARWIDRRAA